MMFSRYFRPFVPGFRVRPQNDLPGLNLHENNSLKAGAWPDAMPLGAQAQRYPDAAQALAQQIFRSSTPSPQLFAQSTPAIGLAGFRATTQQDVPGFKLRLEDTVPGFNLIGDKGGVQRQETTWPYGTHPEYRLPSWLDTFVTMPLSTALDPLTGRRIVPYAPLINTGGAYPAIGQNEHTTGSTQSDVEETSALPDLSSVSAPSDEEWPLPDDDEWPPSDTEEWPPSDVEEWPSSDTDRQSQVPGTGPSRAPSPQQTVQQATWEIQFPRLMDRPLYSEGGGDNTLEDPRSAPVVRLASGTTAPSVRPITDNNFILANARDDATRQRASANSDSHFGQEPVYRIGHYGVSPHRDVPANTGTRNAVIASFGSSTPSANTANQSYGIRSAHPKPFEYRVQPFNAEADGRYSHGNSPIRLTDLAGANTQETTSTSPSMSDAYPEPLISWSAICASRSAEQCHTAQSPDRSYNRASPLPPYRDCRVARCWFRTNFQHPGTP